MKNDSQAFLNLYGPVERQISNYCRALTGNSQDALDLLQDTLLTACENFSGLRKPESFLFFLCGIAKRIYLNQIRRNKFFGDIEKIDHDLHLVPNTAELNMDVEMLYNAINRLPVEQREALVMFEIMGFSLNEIHIFQGGSLSGVKSRVARARTALAGILDAPKQNEVVVKHQKTILP